MYIRLRLHLPVLILAFFNDNIHPYDCVTVHISHSFHGPVVLKSVHGNCVLLASDELLRNSTDMGTIYLFL